MVMYVTEEVLYHDVKFISREDDEGIIAHYNNVRLTCNAEDSHRIGGDVTYIWRVPLKTHCPLYHVRKFKGRIIKYDLPSLTIKTFKAQGLRSLCLFSSWALEKDYKTLHTFNRLGRGLVH